jgi:hypothetical protein
MTDFIVEPSWVEREIVRLSKLLEDATDALGEAAQQHANAEADYRFAYARAFLGAKAGGDDRLTDRIREHQSNLTTTDEFRARRIAEAKQLHLQEKCRQLRAQLDAVRTLSANIRVQT